MKKTFTIFLLLLGIISNSFSQDTVDKTEMVGFACYYAGQPSKTVKKVTNKLNSKNYTSLRKMLYSSNNAEKYLTVISLEKLTEQKDIKLTEQEIITINKIKNSSELVSICSGCTMFMKVELRELFESRMKLFPQNWINQNFK